MSEKQQIITIDGPAGVGKSTVSRRVAAATGFTYLDTGAMYRGVGLYLNDKSVDLDNNISIRLALSKLQMELVPAPDEKSEVGVLLDGVNVGDIIRTPEMAMVASRVSALKEVRDVLTEIQRGYGEKGKIVAEGRDTGTVVFPGAAYKFFLDADPRERAHRRCDQLQAKGQKEDFEKILKMTKQRDKNDREREIAPLKQAEDAVRIDTTNISIDEVVTLIIQSVKEKGVYR